MFTKIDKKILITSVIIFVIILSAAFLFYKYIGSVGTEIENTAGGSNTETQTERQSSDEENITDSAPQVEIQAEPITGDSNSQGFSICLDECGDGICLETDPDCGKDKNNLTCICPETPQECPQDCN
ncbi:MAG: hypothetical protein A2998_01310 [Candidatus Staskawiczbacteria bacterium RIFCSPLOWO2_01_FULL_37_25b]|uniref:Uncharacterized protein n=1 Tax=Candidatus Staskawiczbacteria bacterium RIFCSPLOWO2_01_FULL_37_25b TaxID=1802213 RepID=A0A1G2IF77_9BACT|nr:MAG: hypothetical protein A2998_01310 [Candidatus Staskawiczbacteria bacterium RIFCSPLOWO2_01_FULL_37_25b]